MAFSVNDMKASIGSTGVAKAAHYQIEIPGLTPDALMRATAVQLPGRSVQAATYRDYGASREIAYLPLYTAASVTFLCSSDLRERVAFTEWQDSIIGNHRTGAGGYAQPFDAGYYDDYVRDVTIKQFDSAGSETYQCKLIEAYPRTISDISYSYAAEEVISFSVQLQYRFFTE
jgi:hypothetical protein